MTLTDPKRLAKSLCVKLKRLTNEIVKNAKSKCEIEINELKIDDGESEHDLQIDGTLVKMKTAFIKIRNRSTLSLTDIDDSKEESLEESLNKILSEENIPCLGEGWRKETVRRSPHEAVIVCVKTPDNVELHSVDEAEQYLHSVGVKDVDVEKLFSSPPTPTKNLHNDNVEHEVVKEAMASKCGSDCTNIQGVAVSQVVEPESVTSETDADNATTTTDCSNMSQVGEREKTMTELAPSDINDNRDVEKTTSLSKPSSISKKRKLVQTNMLAFLGQGQSSKKVKLDKEEESLEDKTILPPEIEITGNVSDSDQRILEKVSDDQTFSLDSNSNIQEDDGKCLSDDLDTLAENKELLFEVLEKVPEFLISEETDPVIQEKDDKKQAPHDLVSGNMEEVDETSSDLEDKCESQLGFKMDKNGCYNSKYCEYKTKKKADLKRHNIKKHKQDNKLPTDEIKCIACNTTFTAVDSLEKHSFYTHGDGTELVFKTDKKGQYSCDHCDYMTTKLSNIKAHVFRKHLRIRDENINQEEASEEEAYEEEASDAINIEPQGTIADDSDDGNESPRPSSIEEVHDNGSRPEIPLECSNIHEGWNEEGPRPEIPLESSDLPEGWKRLKVPRKAIGKFDTYVQSPCGKRFNCQKKMDVFIAEKRLKLKNVQFRYCGDSKKGGVKQPKQKQPCKESNNIPEKRSKENPEPVQPKKKNKEVDKENKLEKRQREKKPITEVTDMCATDKEIDESEEHEELTENELDYIAEIDQFMKETNLQLEPKPATKGDGNCWYRAAACQVVFHQISNKPRNHKSMRLEVSNHLKNLPEQVKEDTINVVYMGRPKGLTGLASRQRKAGQWVDNTGVMVMATAHYLERNIHLYGYPTGSETMSRLFSLTRIEGGGQADQYPPLTIFYHDRHYQTLQPPQAEGQESLKPAEAESQESAKPAEVESKESLKPAEVEDQEILKPAEVEGKESLEPAEGQESLNAVEGEESPQAS
eukprot:TRINITY_DN39582_c0_g1_i1.p1 TRINITY_DN39582_c0_g1~~TRINITY_DN39582_c0_g1_i1.p1  ORF type:complete len:984 (-),score=341.52 TRINITY_DN39582_c0_g1_i1:173-3124(-)